MNYDESKSFPYPVLRTGSDDYTECAFQATAGGKLLQDLDTLRIDASFRTSEPTLRKLLKSGEAKFALLVDARETYFRDLITTGDAQISEDYAGGRIKGPVTLSPYILATKDISDFHSPNFNDEYGNKTFGIEPGDVLALYAPREIYVGQEVFTPITGIWRIVEDEEYKMGEFGIGLDNEFIDVLINKEQKEKIATAQEQESSQYIVMAGVYLPALVQVLVYMCEEEAHDGGDFVDQKWYRCIKAKCDDLGIGLNEGPDVLQLAQSLIGYPLGSLNTEVFEKENE